MVQTPPKKCLSANQIAAEIASLVAIAVKDTDLVQSLQSNEKGINNVENSNTHL